MEHYWTLISTDDMGYMLLTDIKGRPLTHMKDETFNPFHIFDNITSIAVMMEVITELEPCGIKQNKHLTEMLPEYYSSLNVYVININAYNESGILVPVVLHATKMKPVIKKYVTAKIIVPDYDDDFSEIETPPLLRNELLLPQHNQDILQ